MNKDWKKIKKGWIRIHVILSIVSAIIFSIAVASTGGFDTLIQFLVGGIIYPLAIYWGLLFITRFLITWIKEGFKED